MSDLYWRHQPGDSYYCVHYTGTAWVASPVYSDVNDAISWCETGSGGWNIIAIRDGEPAALLLGTAPSADDAVEIIEPDPHLFSDITTATHHREH